MGTYRELEPVATMDLDALEALRVELTCAGDQIALAIDKAITRFATTGRRADPEWLARSRFALRCKRGAVSTLERIIARRRQQQRAAAAGDFNAAFLACAREELETDDFLAISEQARKMTEGKRCG